MTTETFTLCRKDFIHAKNYNINHVYNTYNSGIHVTHEIYKTTSQL